MTAYGLWNIAMMKAKKSWHFEHSKSLKVSTSPVSWVEQSVFGAHETIDVMKSHNTREVQLLQHQWLGRNFGR